MNKERIFLVREIKKHFLYLPGGTLEKGETFRDCLRREIYEELGVRPIVGELICIREFETKQGMYLDIWFNVENTADFLYIDKHKATHAFEYYDEGFYGFDEIESQDVRPQNLKNLINRDNINIL